MEEGKTFGEVVVVSDRDRKAVGVKNAARLYGNRRVVSRVRAR